MNATSTRQNRRRRIGVTVAAITAALTLAACAAGQIAETANEKTSLDGTFGTVGNIQLEGVAVHAPFVPGRSTGAQFYVKGDYAPMSVSIVNTGRSPDTLTSVTSPAFSGWNIVPTTKIAVLPPTSSAQPGSKPTTSKSPSKERATLYPASITPTGPTTKSPSEVRTTVSPPTGSAKATTSPVTAPSAPLTSVPVTATESATPAPSTPPKFSGSGHPVQVAGHKSLALGLDNLGYLDPTTGLAATSPNTLVLTGLTKDRLYPGSSVPITFTFKNAGSLTLHVPVQLSSYAPRETVPAPPTPTAG